VIRPGLPVMCAGASFEPLPGRVAASEQPGRWWVVVCLAGVHLPQVYDEGDLTEIREVAGSGLCAECATARPALPAGSAPFALTAKVGV
jgi:hypothetical protein